MTRYFKINMMVVLAYIYCDGLFVLLYGIFVFTASSRYTYPLDFYIHQYYFQAKKKIFILSLSTSYLKNKADGHLSMQLRNVMMDCLSFGLEYLSSLFLKDIYFHFSYSSKNIISNPKK